jgi:hypothetical protein
LTVLAALPYAWQTETPIPCFEEASHVKRPTAFAALLGLVLWGVSGCVQTQVTRQIQVHKDASGKITGFTEIESATQVGQAFKFSGMEHLKAGPKETEPLKIY